MPEEAPSPTGDHRQPNESLTLHIQRMNADRLTVVVDGPNMLVESLRERIRQQTRIPVERQRLIFRGRVLKNGEPLSNYDIQNESVLHLVERPEHPTSAPPAPESSTNSAHTSASREPRPGLAGATANILLHTMQVDPSAGPAAVAQEISRSVMEALRGVMDGTGPEGREETTLPGAFFSNLFSPFVTGATANGNLGRGGAAAGGQAPNPSTMGSQFDPFSPSTPAFTAGGAARARSTGASVPSSGAANSVPSTTSQSPSSSLSPAATQSRLLSRPTSAVRPPAMANPPAPLASSSTFSSSNHQTVRTDLRRALYNLNRELGRLTTLADGSALFTSTIQPSTAPDSHQGPASGVQLLASNLEHFERAYWMLASGCREVREALQPGPSLTETSTTPTLPWDRLANLLALLHELPLLMVSQRRLLGTLRAAPPHGSVELPPSLDVPSFLAKEEGTVLGSGNNTGSAGRVATPSPNPMDIIEPPE